MFVQCDKNNHKPTSTNYFNPSRLNSCIKILTFSSIICVQKFSNKLNLCDAIKCGYGNKDVHANRDGKLTSCTRRNCRKLNIDSVSKSLSVFNIICVKNALTRKF